MKIQGQIPDGAIFAKYQRNQAEILCSSPSKNKAINDALNLDESTQETSDIMKCAALGNVLKRTRSTLDITHFVKEFKCYFCDRMVKQDEQCDASTFKLDLQIRHCAEIVHDSKLLGKLSTGDMIAIEAKYQR